MCPGPVSAETTRSAARASPRLPRSGIDPAQFRIPSRPGR